MFKVVFEGVTIFQSKSDVDAVSFALALHQQSNVSHSIKVFLDADDIPICFFTKHDVK